MHRRTHLAALLAAVIVLTGCNGTVDSPVAPSGSSGVPSGPPPAPPLPPEIAGTIVVRSIAPEPGTTLIVQNCSFAGPDFPYLCADQLRLAFDLQVDQDIPNGVLSALFTAAGSTCALSSERVTLTAGTQTTIRMQGAEISSDGALFRCPLPADTTQILVRLSGSGRVLLTREFAYDYRFVLE
jgi:hypothetical protein